MRGSAAFARRWIAPGRLKKPAQIRIEESQQQGRARFENKGILITGAGSGIGRAASLAFSTEGAAL